MLASAATAQTPPESPYYARVNTYGIFTAYSNDSSHILLGDAEQRKLFDVGASYNRRLFLNRIVNWQYSGEILPVALEGDPETHVVENQTYPTSVTQVFNYPEANVSCTPITQPYKIYLDNGTVSSSGTYTTSCAGRTWNIGEAISPVGMQWNFLPRLKTQPFFTGHGGYMYTTHPIPVEAAGSFNFTFDLGAGIELYRSKTRSIRAEYRYHHISNHDTAYQNPGIDNGLFQVTYTFGR
jgi:opacity protein-like surface antigen